MKCRTACHQQACHVGCLRSAVLLGANHVFASRSWHEHFRIVSWHLTGLGRVGVPAFVGWSPAPTRQGVCEGRFGIDVESGIPATGFRRRGGPRVWRIGSHCSGPVEGVFVVGRGLPGASPMLEAGWSSTCEHAQGLRRETKTKMQIPVRFITHLLRGLLVLQFNAISLGDEFIRRPAATKAHSGPPILKVRRSENAFCLSRRDHATFLW